MRLSQIRLLTADFPAMVRFYRDVLGLRADWGNEDGDYASFIVPEGGSVVALFRRALMERALDAEPVMPVGDRAVVVFDVPDVDTMLASLWQRGAEVASPPTDQPAWGLRVAHVRDPDGNLIELVQPLPPEACHPERETVSQARAPSQSHDRVEAWGG